MAEATKLLEKTLFCFETALRQSGRTSRIANEAKKTGAIMVCHNHSFARHVATEFDIQTVSLDNYLDTNYRRGMKSTKHVFDHMVEYALIMKKLSEVEGILNESMDTNYSRF
jgi:hypothetical protein